MAAPIRLPNKPPTAAPITVPANRLPTLPPMALPIRPPVTAPTAVPPASFGPESAVQAATLRPRSANAMTWRADMTPNAFRDSPTAPHLALQTKGGHWGKTLFASATAPRHGSAASRYVAAARPGGCGTVWLSSAAIPTDTL